MASHTTKILVALVALLALSTIAANAASCPQSFMPMTGIDVISPCMQSCMMRQSSFTMGGSLSPVGIMDPMDLCMQSCMVQQAFTMGIMSPQCHCGVMCQTMMMQQQRMAMATPLLPYMCNTATMSMLPTYCQQLFPRCSF
uniref:10 kDa prolamin n=1 Tax=Eleusine coracana subsp. coracana TaxID=191504 RepID=A0A6G8MUV5_ELECO|nr:10 kDa prolamin [Eleusine coracana subsp. coracana]